VILAAMSDRARNVPLATAIVAAAIATAIAAVHLFVAPVPGIAALEGLTTDARFIVRGKREPASDRVVIVGLDDKTRAAAPEIFQTRRGWAKLLRALARYDAKIIALDLFFSAPEVILPDPLTRRVRDADAEYRRAPAPSGDEDQLARFAAIIADVAGELRGDDQLADAIAETRRVYLGAYFHYLPDREQPGAPPPPEPMKLDTARYGEAADAGAGGSRRPAHTNYVDFTLPQIARGAVGAGAVNSLPDGDAVHRRMPLAVEYGGHVYLPLGLAVALGDLGKPRDATYIVGDATLTAGGKTLPVGEAASINLDVLGRGKLPRVSAADVLAGTAPREALAGKLVFVGYTYAAYDKIATPFDRITDGIELHATLCENFLAGRILHRAGPLATLLATGLLGLLVAVAQLRPVRRRAWVPPVVALAALAAYAALAQLLFDGGTIVDVALPLVMTALVLVAATVGGLATEGREKAHLRAVFSRYVSRTVVDRILAEPARAKLGGERKELTVLFSDIRNFSSFAEAMGPEELASFLGEYLTPMTALVLESGGTLDKYIGDAVMAIWAAPVDLPDHAARACDVALRMQAALGDLNAKWKREGKPQIAIGIGLNTGVMSVGNMGSAARFDYTVLGDQVNLGARLEALTKEYGIGILVGEATAKAAGPAFVFREVDLVRVKGRAAAAPVFQLLGRTGETHIDDRWTAALAAYRERDFAGARAGFAELSGDPAAAALATRCAKLAETPPGDDWDGVYEQRSK
jgi:adenylate cyclase